MYINDYGEREADWYEVKRFLKGSNGNDDGRGVTYHKTRRQAEKAKQEAESTGLYEALLTTLQRTAGLLTTEQTR